VTSAPCTAPHQISCVGAESGSNRQLAAALNDRLRYQTVHADRGEQHTRRGEAREQRHPKRRLLCRIVDQACRRAQLGHRSARIDRAHDSAQVRHGEAAIAVVSSIRIFDGTRFLLPGPQLAHCAVYNDPALIAGMCRWIERVTLEPQVETTARTKRRTFDCPPGIQLAPSSAQNVHPSSRLPRRWLRTSHHRQQVFAGFRTAGR
jgi:hypothetical protein